MYKVRWGRLFHERFNNTDAAKLFEEALEGGFEDLDGPIRRVTSLDTPVPYAPGLEEYFLPNPAKVVAAARELARY